MSVIYLSDYCSDVCFIDSFSQLGGLATTMFDQLNTAVHLCMFLLFMYVFVCVYVCVYVCSKQLIFTSMLLDCVYTVLYMSNHSSKSVLTRNG